MARHSPAARLGTAYEDGIAGKSRPALRKREIDEAGSFQPPKEPERLLQSKERVSELPPPDVREGPLIARIAMLNFKSLSKVPVVEDESRRDRNAVSGRWQGTHDDESWFRSVWRHRVGHNER